MSFPTFNLSSERPRCSTAGVFKKVSNQWSFRKAAFVIAIILYLHVSPRRSLQNVVIPNRSISMEKGCDERSVYINSIRNAEAEIGGADSTVEVFIFTSVPETDDKEASSRLINRWISSIVSTDSDDSSVKIKTVLSNNESRREFLKLAGGQCYRPRNNGYKNPQTITAMVLSRYDDFIRQGHTNLALELWKYCSLSIFGGVFVPIEVIILDYFRQIIPILPSPNNDSLFGGVNYATISNKHPGVIEDTFLAIDHPMSSVSLGMVRHLLEINLEEMESFWLQKKLYQLITSSLGMGDKGDADESEYSLFPGWNAMKSSPEKWVLFTQRCSSRKRKLLTKKSSKTVQCETIDPCTKSIKMILRISSDQLPSQIQYSPIRKPYLYQLSNLDSMKYNEKPEVFISTITEKIFVKPPDHNPTPNFYHMLKQADITFLDDSSMRCLQRPQEEEPHVGASCTKCSHLSPVNQYCEMLCRQTPEKKFVAKHYVLSPPKVTHDEGRLIPRLIHQTWSENISNKKYPDLSRLSNSWKQSGWKYRFYDNANVQDFLTVHFPAEILETYNALLPAAFKADLFRYCVLLIYGGVYADIDIMLESSLDVAIDVDVGFMVPHDLFGDQFQKQACLWNGLLASAPSHPFLVNTIETIVNHVRNRYTSIDIDNYLCHKQQEIDFRYTHGHDFSYVTGSCLLGSTVNHVLGREGQADFIVGHLTESSYVYGRSIILSNKNNDMGVERFTLEEKNLIVAATDLKFMERDMRKGGGLSYSETHLYGEIYGLDRVYVNQSITNENIKIILESMK